MRTCPGCSHPTICRVQGCAVPEARRNKAAALTHSSMEIPMNQNDTDILIGALDSLATSLETLTRLACHMAVNAGVPADVIAPPESDIPSGQG